ncbi:hypothetical protein BD310DRAFT_915207 [Dichomitus squalens]|uniref:C2H2-type domain-containing protein n=1 Tax=Dichomitus squalens TaxID=114155 RepID=A0A4V2K9I3_9APHY|nr:hypothetical protein BD310DRAFT_915207 [Dichomitus squalens]
MSSRHNNLLPGSFGRLSTADLNQGVRHSPTRRETYSSSRDTRPPPSESPNSLPAQSQCVPPQSSSKEKQPNATRATQLPLSIYELPTATFMWARWKPDDDSQTRIFVRYRTHQSDTDSASTYSSSTYSRPHSPVSYISPRISPVSTPPPLPYSRKRSSSAESDDDSLPSPSDRFLKLPRIFHNNAPSRVDSARSATPRIPHEYATYSDNLGDKEAMEAYPSGSGAGSDSSDVELRPAAFFYPAHQSNSSRGEATFPRSMTPTADTPAPAYTALREESEESESDLKNEWIKYTFPSPETSAGPDFHCTWQEKQRDGTSKPCGYSSKKHLVKRHIESKHLQLRPCKCKFCGKGFSQKSNLDTHLNTHTNNAPHKCHYCDEHFKDPARRHRHMIQVHRHVSSRTKKGRLGTDVRAGSVAEASGPDVEDLTAPQSA